MSDELTDYEKREAAVLLLAVDAVICADYPTAEEALEHARLYARSVDTEPEWANGRHEGDCTNRPFTCARCSLEEYEAEAVKRWNE